MRGQWRSSYESKPDTVCLPSGFRSTGLSPLLGREQENPAVCWRRSNATGSMRTEFLVGTSGGAIRVESNEVLVPVLVLGKVRLAELQHMDPYVFQRQIANWERPRSPRKSVRVPMGCRFGSAFAIVLTDTHA
jgi:hypothetical protein